MYVIAAELMLPSHSDLIVAVAAIYWSAFTGLERYFGVLTTLGAHSGEHLAGSVTVAATSVTLGLSCLAASGASLGLVGIALGLEELLLLGAESEGSPAVGTLE
jgi:hypothetical protein